MIRITCAAFLMGCAAVVAVPAFAQIPSQGEELAAQQPAEVQTHEVIAQVRSWRTEVAQGHAKVADAAALARLQAAFSEIESALSGAQHWADVSGKDLKAITTAHAQIVAILDLSPDSALACKRRKPAGSKMLRMSCQLGDGDGRERMDRMSSKQIQIG